MPSVQRAQMSDSAHSLLHDMARNLNRQGLDQRPVTHLAQLFNTTFSAVALDIDDLVDLGAVVIQDEPKGRCVLAVCDCPGVTYTASDWAPARVDATDIGEQRLSRRVVTQKPKPQDAFNQGTDPGLLEDSHTYPDQGVRAERAKSDLTKISFAGESMIPLYAVERRCRSRSDESEDALMMAYGLGRAESVNNDAETREGARGGSLPKITVGERLVRKRKFDPDSAAGLYGYWLQQVSAERFDSIDVTNAGALRKLFADLKREHNVSADRIRCMIDHFMANSPKDVKSPWRSFISNRDHHYKATLLHEAELHRYDPDWWRLPTGDVE